MTGVRLLVGTQKGAFVASADGHRKEWEVSGPHFGGWEIYHLVGAPTDPMRLYASQSTGWFGQIIQRSDDGGPYEQGREHEQVRRSHPKHRPVVSATGQPQMWATWTTVGQS